VILPTIPINPSGSIDKDKWLYLSNKTNYLYATGFNLVRVLDKLKINYKARLFNEVGLSLELRFKQNRMNKTTLDER
jgi:hypothetical protein